MVESFGKYLLLEKLASGGMAEVYLSKSIGANGINKFVAIKRILPQYSDNPEFIEMFKEEAKIAVNLNHSNIVSIYDFGIEKRQFFLVMEFVEGQNLRQVLNHMKKEGKDFSLDQIVFLIKEVAAGLDHAHRCLDGTTGRPLNITHRDMSPQNVMVSFEGETKIVDFGIAKAETQMESTRAGTIKGKFGYMSPEQAEGHTVDTRTDVFSLGIVLWELLAKDRLFSAQNEAATLRKVRECQIPNLRKINPAVPAELERICMKALAKDKSLRYQTAAAFHKDLNRFLNTQFPDFSTQEFSKFMKALYHKMYLENRKKLADFAKIGIDDSDDKTMVTMTQTETGNISPNQSPQVVSSQQNIDSGGINLNPSQKVDLESLRNSKEKLAAKPNQMPFHTQTGTYTSAQYKTMTGSSVRRQFIPSFLLNQTTALILVGVILGVGYLAWKKSESKFPMQAINREISSQLTTPQHESQVQPVMQTTESSSEISVSLNIQSKPQGAIVYVNGQNVGITPYIGHIPSGKNFQIAIKKDGYLTYTRPAEDLVVNLYRLEATLQPEPPMGYVSIEIVGQSGADTVLTINNQRITDTSQWSRYPIPAGTATKIRASSPFARLLAEETVTVGAGQKKSVRLILKRIAEQPDSN